MYPSSKLFNDEEESDKGRVTRCGESCTAREQMVFKMLEYLAPLCKLISGRGPDVHRGPALPNENFVPITGAPPINFTNLMRMPRSD